MDLTTVNLYTNPFFAQNFYGLQHPNYPNSFAPPRGNDVYRYEDGSGDASGSLLLGDNDEATLCGTTMTFDPNGSSVRQVCSNGNMQLVVKRSQLKMEETKHYGCQWPASYVSRVPRSPTSIQVGMEKFIIQYDTIFVLNMRLNVTKNDISMFFGKMGRIQMDEMTEKPKIFVYKNKLTGRSKGEATITYVSPYAAQAAINYLNGTKFMGQMVTVVPAYLSTKTGTNMRYSYKREPGVELQRRHRESKWKPASDNWFCDQCKNSNFAWRVNCNRCLASRQDVTQSPEIGKRPWRPMKNDWPCGYCFNVNFWYRQKCNRCGAPRSEQSTSDPEKWELTLSQTSTE